jgi:hypothetical protein
MLKAIPTNGGGNKFAKWDPQSPLLTQSPGAAGLIPHTLS